MEFWLLKQEENKLKKFFIEFMSLIIHHCKFIILKNKFLIKRTFKLF